ncbi:MAG TPA: GTP 3',8-cyclase MoaA [Vicinamibacterales bacterium]|nr:GTP 3',8-cyclase MoaA [Vicinamibacterales bacterium]
MPTIDRLGRPLANLRVSVTDRCNLRCSYCMPEQEYVWLPREDILDFEEIARLATVFASLGVERLRITGGEPLLRRNLGSLIRLLAAIDGIKDLAMTTNGVLLADQAETLRAAGLHRITVSLDTLDRERFRRLTRTDDLPRVLAGIEAAVRCFPIVKIDTVVIRGVNDDEMPALVEFGRARGAEVRFIEYMDVGGATRWSMADVFTRKEMLEVLTRHVGALEPIHERTSAPADRYRLPDGTTIGIISSTTQPFCRTCDRARLTADGLWLLCLYAVEGTDLRALLRSGASDAAIRDAILAAWTGRTDRGAEQRLNERERQPFVPVSRLRRNPHLEMHTRGG